MSDVLATPCELIDADLDLVAGGQNTIAQSIFIEGNNNTAVNSASISSSAPSSGAIPQFIQEVGPLLGTLGGLVLSRL